VKLSKNILQQYEKSRSGTYKAIVCHAPFVSMNFEQNGNIRACCYNFKHILGTWPKNSIKETWSGKPAADLRKYIMNNDLGGGCAECGNMIIAGNHYGARARFYDEYAPAGIISAVKYFNYKVAGNVGYPKVMEFELSNNCNLECIMCNGYFSSSIRKNREKLPALESPYNDAFVDELNDFIPHLTDAKFLGGEPFMIDIYLKIWERIRALNPNMRIHITTNGTFLTNRVKNLLEGLKAGIILSIDSVNRDTYHKIRINGNYDKVMENIEYFRDYTQKKKTFFSIAACPITNNWHELPEMLNFCLEKNITLYFNAVFTPEKLSIKEQPLEIQEKIIEYLKKNPAPEIKGSLNQPRNLSIKAYNDFIKLLQGWANEKNLQVLRNETDKNKSWSAQESKGTIIDLAEMEMSGYFNNEREAQQQLYKLLLNANEKEFAETMMHFVETYHKNINTDLSDSTKEKIRAITKMLFVHPMKASIIKSMSLAPPLEVAKNFIEKSIEELAFEINRFTD